MKTNEEQTLQTEAFDLLQTMQQKFEEWQTAVFGTETISTNENQLMTDRQSIDARLNDGRLTADEAKQKTMRKMMHDLHIL